MVYDQSTIMELIKKPTLFDSNKIVARWPPSLEDWKNKFENRFLMLKVFTPSNETKEERDHFRVSTMKSYGYDIFS